MEEKKILKVKMLGGFSLKYGKKDIILDRNIAAKTVRLMELVCLGEKERRISRQYRKAIHDTLRKGDFYTKYNYGQYLVFLSGISQKNCKVVSERIDETFAQISEKTGCRADLSGWKKIRVCNCQK